MLPYKMRPHHKNPTIGYTDAMLNGQYHDQSNKNQSYSSSTIYGTHSQPHSIRYTRIILYILMKKILCFGLITIQYIGFSFWRASCLVLSLAKGQNMIQPNKNVFFAAMRQVLCAHRNARLTFYMI